MEELAQYIMQKLGDKVYDELFIDPEDYNTLPAYEFYQEVVENCRIEHPEIIKEFDKEQENEYYSNLPKENITASTVNNDFDLACKITADILRHTSKYNLAKPHYRICHAIYTPFFNMTRSRSYDELKEYLEKNSKGCLPNSKINCKKFYNQIVFLARNYRNQYHDN